MLVVFCHFLTRYTPLKLFLQDFHKISHKIAHSISCKIFPQDFPARILQDFPQDFPARFSRKNFRKIFPQDFPATISHKIVPQEFPARFSRKIFTRISRKIFLQNFSKLDPDWLAPHHPIPNAKFPPITALLNRPTYHKRSKVSPPPFP